MIKGTVSYRASFPGIEFDSMEVSCADPMISKITIASLQTGVTLTIEIDQSPSTTDALEKAAEIAELVAKVLTFASGVLFRTFGGVEHALTEEQPAANGSPSTVHHLGSTLNLRCTVEMRKNIAPAEKARYKGALEAQHRPGFVYYDLLRGALALDDPLSRFMALYCLVLDLCGGGQEAVDQFVLSVEPNVPTNPPYKKRSSGTSETIYTRLRNEVGHVRPGTTIEGTRNEMASNLTGLILIAKALISQKP